MPDNLIPERAEIVALDVECEVGRLSTNLTNVQRCGTRPLLIGHSITTSGRSLLIMGGGAVCFSFGTFWNRGCYTISLDEVSDSNPNASDKRLAGSLEPWRYLNTVDDESNYASKVLSQPSPPGYERPREPVAIARRKISSPSDFAAILSAAKPEPVILEGLDLGSCTNLWTNSYLLNHIGQHRNASHVLSQASMVLICAGNCPPGQCRSYGLYIKKLSICYQRLW